MKRKALLGGGGDAVINELWQGTSGRGEKEWGFLARVQSLSEFSCML